MDAITCAGSNCRCTWDEVAAELARAVNEMTALAAQTIRFALQLPNLQWLAFEQVPAIEYMFEDIAAELMSVDDETGSGPGWESADVFTVEASNLGLPVHRKRSFLVARRYQPLGGVNIAHPAITRLASSADDIPTMSKALGWDPGHHIRTRGKRKATGGNLFTADGPSWCLTEKARSWERVADGTRLTPSEAGLLQGFPRDYPWHGSRTRQFHQIGDVVLPPVAAAVLGYATGTPWVQPVRRYLDNLYDEELISHRSPTIKRCRSNLGTPEQMALFPPTQ